MNNREYTPSLIINPDVNKDFLFQLHAPDYASHFFKKEDTHYIRNFLSLLNNIGIENIFLHGGAVNNFILSGKRKYSDIDIIGTGEDDGMQNIFQLFDVSSMDDSIMFYENAVYKIKKIDIPGAHYDLRHYKLNNNLKIVLPIEKDFNELDTPKTIDLLLMTEDYFRRNIQEQYFEFAEDIRPLHSDDLFNM